VADVDRLTIVSHDRFQKVVDHANDPNSIIRTGAVVGRDIPDNPTQAVTIASTILSVLGLALHPAPGCRTAIWRAFAATRPMLRNWLCPAMPDDAVLHFGAVTGQFLPGSI
jgi:hypothetical protein